MVDNKENSFAISRGHYMIRLVTVCLFLALALTLYFLNVINFACVILILFGALWNFFVPINSFVSFVFCLIVCSIYALFAISEGLYSNALLYFFVYIFFQYIIWVLYSDANMKIEDKNLSKRNIYFITCSIVVGFVICFAISLVQKNQILPLLDALSASLLGLSAFFQTFKYREYFIIRPLALILAIILWVFVAYINNFSGVDIAVILMYTMYLVLDLIFIAYRIKDIAFVKKDKKQPDTIVDSNKINDKKAIYKKMTEADKGNEKEGIVKA